MLGDKLIIPRQRKGCTLVEDLSVENLQSSEEEAIEVSPCTSERGEVMAEIDLSPETEGKFLDIGVLCELLESYEDRFAEMKCSRKLGVGKVRWKARKVYFYENGKFKVRFAHSKEDAIQTLNSAIRLIYASIICEKCGRPTVDCILGFCEECTTDEPVQSISPEDYFNGPLLIRGLESLEKAMEESRKLRKEYSLEDSKWPSNVEKSMERKLRTAIENAMNFSLKSQQSEAPRIGATLISSAWRSLVLLDKMRELAELTEEGDSDKMKTLIGELNSSAWQFQESLLDGIRNEKRREKNNDAISKFLETLKELKGVLEEADFNNADEYNMIFEELEEYINESEKLLAKVEAGKASNEIR